MKKLVAVLVAMFVVAFTNAAFAEDDDNPDWSKQQGTGSSGIGESCRRRADCKEGLKCVRHTCNDPHEGETCGATADCGGELKCINQRCTSPNAAATSAPVKTPVKNEGNEGEGGGDAKPETSNAAASTDWIKFKVDDGGTHPFIGITGPLFGFDIVGLDGGAGTNFGPVGNAVLFAFKAGLIVGGHHELGVEITPFFTAAPGAPVTAVFEMNASYAYLIPIADHVSWPLRVGAGIMAGPSPNAADNAWFEVRADLVGVNINVGHVLIDLHLPSFRYFVTSSNGATAHIMNWLFGMSFGYAF
jgi:hypothetical protein